MTLRLFQNLSENISSHFLLSKWTDGEFGRRLEALEIPYSSSWLGMISRQIDPANLKMTLHCLSKLPVLYRDFLDLLRILRPHIIYVAHYHELQMLLPILFQAKVPIIYHAHNLLPATNFHKASFTIWGSTVDHFIPVSRSVQTSIESLGIPTRKISLLYNGIDLDAFPYFHTRLEHLAVQFGWNKDVLIVGMTGQMIPGKGHSDFLQAAFILRQEFANLRFVIGGRKDGAYYAQLKEEVAALNLDGIVGFSDWQENMSSFYSGLDIFAFPSYQKAEGFGLVIAEAMATGLPVVVTRTGGATEVIEDGVSGLLIDPQVPHKLADAIRNLILSPMLRMELSKSGRERVESLFNLSRQTLSFEQILQSVMEAHGYR